MAITHYRKLFSGFPKKFNFMQVIIPYSPIFKGVNFTTDCFLFGISESTLREMKVIPSSLILNGVNFTTERFAWNVVRLL